MQFKETVSSREAVLLHDQLKRNLPLAEHTIIYERKATFQNTLVSIKSLSNNHEKKSKIVESN